MVSAKLAALTALLPLATALETRAPDAGPGFIRFPITGRTGANPVGKHSKRQEEVSIVDRQSGTLYTIDVTLGTPGQTVPVHFDTGAPELWVNPQCEYASDKEFCEAQGRFTESNTLDDLDTPGQLVYGSGYANIQYVSDHVAIGSKMSPLRDSDAERNVRREVLTRGTDRRKHLAADLRRRRRELLRQCRHPRRRALDERLGERIPLHL